MVVIRRVAEKEYRLETENGDLIERYNVRKMTHPSDWESDARESGHEIDGANGWKYKDTRDTE